MARSVPAHGELEAVILQLETAASALRRVTEINLRTRTAAPIHISSLRVVADRALAYTQRALADSERYAAETRILGKSGIDASRNAYAARKARAEAADVTPPKKGAKTSGAKKTRKRK